MEEVDVGRLFGALAVLQAVGQMILGVRSFPSSLYAGGINALVPIADAFWTDIQWDGSDVPEDDICDVCWDPRYGSRACVSHTFSSRP